MASPYYNVFPQDTSFPIASAVVVDNIFNQTSLGSTTITQFYNIAYPLQIRWKAGDFDNTTTITASTAAATTGTTGSSHMASVTATAVPSAAPSGPSSKGLSTGSIAAIAVVAGIVVLAALGFFIWWRRRAGRAQGGKRFKDPSIGEKKYANAGELETSANIPELGGQHEQARAELGDRDRAELEGTGRSELG